MDRNKFISNVCPPVGRSLSARRAWIEIISVRGHGFWPRWSLSARRAWIEIVDVVSVQHGCESLSARRAWIEIDHPFHRVGNIPVALRKESVDRNKFISNVCPPVGRSLSARRAWIEIGRNRRPCSASCVALRKESVDRNTYPSQCRTLARGRSPQGERG